MGFQYFGENDDCNDQTKNKCSTDYDSIQVAGVVVWQIKLTRYLITCLTIFKIWSIEWKLSCFGMLDRPFSIDL